MTLPVLRADCAEAVSAIGVKLIAATITAEKTFMIAPWFLFVRSVEDDLHQKSTGFSQLASGCQLVQFKCDRSEGILLHRPIVTLRPKETCAAH